MQRCILLYYLANKMMMMMILSSRTRRKPRHHVSSDICRPGTCLSPDNNDRGHLHYTLVSVRVGTAGNVRDGDFRGTCVRGGTNAQHALRINVTYDFNSVRFYASAPAPCYGPPETCVFDLSVHLCVLCRDIPRPACHRRSCLFVRPDYAGSDRLGCSEQI